MGAGGRGHAADEHSDHRPQSERNQAQNRLSLGRQLGFAPSRESQLKHSVYQVLLHT